MDASTFTSVLQRSSWTDFESEGFTEIREYHGVFAGWRIASLSGFEPDPRVRRSTAWLIDRLGRYGGHHSGHSR